jgi:hypothetical protein
MLNIPTSTHQLNMIIFRDIAPRTTVPMCGISESCIPAQMGQPQSRQRKAKNTSPLNNKKMDLDIFCCDESLPSLR